MATSVMFVISSGDEMIQKIRAEEITAYQLQNRQYWMKITRLPRHDFSHDVRGADGLL
jgi:NifB/MoaA-like Fe-S oxidoreductase